MYRLATPCRNQESSPCNVHQDTLALGSFSWQEPILVVLQNQSMREPVGSIAFHCGSAPTPVSTKFWLAFLVIAQFAPMWMPISGSMMPFAFTLGAVATPSHDSAAVAIDCSGPGSRSVSLVGLFCFWRHQERTVIPPGCYLHPLVDTSDEVLARVHL
ncbi:hypothetical protein BCR34DRAFT_577331 [Clohesyomyces aquaticus]|uniref:Uncharacterized protein n=1 Tax=Clohesyomyces aquaticus TaxID=1231657 RepID=A0A1Y1YK66_9PLEO|nr:hypothetical protein BCR34DRAFT_577331 [Clohesyomyces aquaticus]